MEKEVDEFADTFSSVKENYRLIKNIQRFNSSLKKGLLKKQSTAVLQLYQYVNEESLAGLPDWKALRKYCLTRAFYSSLPGVGWERSWHCFGRCGPGPYNGRRIKKRRWCHRTSLPVAGTNHQRIRFGVGKKLGRASATGCLGPGLAPPQSKDFGKPGGQRRAVRE